MNKNLRKELGKLSRSFFLLYLALAFLSMGLVVYIFQSSQHRLARSYVMSARTNIITRDYRQAILALVPALSDGFSSISVFEAQGKHLFSLPSNKQMEEEKKSIFIISSEQRVFTDSSGKDVNLFAVLYFRYSINWPIIVALLIVICLFVIFILIFRVVRKKVEVQHEILIQKNALEVTELISKQVAHDIRGPVGTINLIVSKLEVPEQFKDILELALQRICAMADELVEQHKKKQFGSKLQDMNSLVVTNEASGKKIDLNKLISALIEEKKLVVGTRISFFLEMDELKYHDFSIDEVTLSRVFSNLVNNSIEAMQNQPGRVTIAVRDYREKVIFQVHDNGKGIPPNILNQLGRVGITHGKGGTASGSGLGIAHAKKAIVDSGGLFEINSQEGIGTLINITLFKRI